MLGEISLDSDVDLDEARDCLGELRSFTRPPAVNAPISVIFLVDLSSSMKKRDIHGRDKLRRIDAVVDVLKTFIVQQRSAGAVMDLYSLVTLSMNSYEVKFLRRTSSEAIADLGCANFEPAGVVNYDEIVSAVTELSVPGQVCRAVFLSDGCPETLRASVLPDFQALFAASPNVVLHCIGFGPKDFSILQQVAQIGRGSFSCASLDVENLVNTFSSLSKTVTETRNTVCLRDRKIRCVAFESATRYSGCRLTPSTKSKFIMRPREAWRYTFTLCQGAVMTRTKQKCTFQLHRNPFMQGGMRLVYRCRDADIRTEMVAKLSRYAEHDNCWQFVRGFAKNTAQTRMLTQEFHKAIWWAILTARRGPSLPTAPPPLPPAPAPGVSQRERGRSPARRQAGMLAHGLPSEETLKAQELLLCQCRTKAKRLLFVGECTHLFTVAAARLVALWLRSEHPRLEWCTTELSWPTSEKMRSELRASQASLRPFGIDMSENVDATNLKLKLEGLAGAVWVMPFPHDMQAQSGSREVVTAIQGLCTGFVQSTSEYLSPGEDGVGGTVSVILLAHQHLAWKLPITLQTRSGTFLREVFWIDLVPFLTYGYRPRFGDNRDSHRRARYHEGDEVVIVRWRRKLNEDDQPGGMTDQRVRSESANRRSCSRGRSSSRGRRDRSR
ncbi:mhkC [Symbiodinium sp. CCMP2456]|nr:mhkC [Symbiodinium sp. CCMP2456]